MRNYARNITRSCLHIILSIKDLMATSLGTNVVVVTRFHCTIYFMIKKENFTKMSLKICFLELWEEFLRNSKTSSNWPQLTSCLHFQGRQLCQNCICLLSEKGSTLKGKNLLMGANSFLF